MPAEPKTPEISPDPIEALGGLTATDYCKPAAVRQVHQQLADAKDGKRALETELRAEHTRNTELTTRAVTAETELRTLRAIVRLNDRRDRFVRLIEFGMVIDISFMIDAARSSSWTLLVGLGIGAISLAGAVLLIQWWPSTPENQ